MFFNRKSIYNYPEGKDFIFTIFDDTDVATLDYIQPVYDYLYSLNIFTTKSVWPLNHKKKTPYQGSDTLEKKEYSDYIRLLHKRGFEIGFHGPSMDSSERDRIKKSYDTFFKTLGFYPRSYAAHANNRENLYWGESRFAFYLSRILYRFLTKEKKEHYQGHIKSTQYFWGDLAIDHIDYMRKFTFNTINLLNISRDILFYDKNQKWANYWFIASDADNVEEFNRLLRDKNQEKLEREGGRDLHSQHTFWKRVY